MVKRDVPSKKLRAAYNRTEDNHTTKADAALRMAERDARRAEDTRTATERLLGEPPPHQRQLKPLNVGEPNPHDIGSAEDVHAGMIVGRFIARALFGNSLPPTPRPGRRRRST